MKMPFASMRATRTSVPTPEAITHSLSDAIDLDHTYSDDSSVFSGLAEGSQGPADPEDDDLEVTRTMGTSSEESESIHRPYESRYSHNHSHNTTRTNIRKGILLPFKTQSSSFSKTGGTSSDESDYTSILTSDVPTGSSVTDRSRLRELAPMVDSDTAFGLSSTVSSSQPPTKRPTDGSYNEPGVVPWPERGDGDYKHSQSAGSRPAGKVITPAANPYMFSDEDTNTQMTWASANDIPRPKGTVKLLSQVTFLGDQKQEERSIDQEKGKLRIPAQHPASTQCHTQQQQAYAHPDEQRQPIDENVSDDSGSRIVEMLNDFEKQMDANLKIIQEDNAISDETAEVLSELQDMTPRRVKSEDDTSAVLTPHKARKLQRILHKARKEVEALRDNNEQYKSEIEQMEEEYKSELKLIEDRTKHKLAELRSVYQEEIDKLVLEKDAAIIEAGRQAARYAESGKKQVLTLRKQLERLTVTATATIKEKVEEAGRLAIDQKDKEIVARLGALRTSYENELEKVRKEFDVRVKSEVKKAVTSVAQRVRMNQDGLVNELKQQIEILQNERLTIQTGLKAVQGNFDKHYPDEMKLFAKKSQDFVGSARKLLDDGPSASEGTEKDLKEVIETFAFLLECKEKKVASFQYLSEIEETKRERNEVYSQMRKELLLRHRAEIEHLRKEKSDAQDKLKVMETNFKNLGREKRFLEEKHRRSLENHRDQIEKLQAEKDAALEMEKSKRELAVAMAAGQRELNNALPKHSGVKSTRKDKIERIELKHSGFSDTPSIPATPSKALILDGDSSDNQQKYAFESASARKARTFLKHHSPRNSPRFSPRHSLHERRLSFTEKRHNQEESPVKSYDNVVVDKSSFLPKEMTHQTAISASNGDENAVHIEERAISSIRKTKDSEDTRNLNSGPQEVQSKRKAVDTSPSHTRESVDLIPDVTNSKSDSSSSSIKSRETILSNLRNQSKTAKDNAEEMNIKNKIELGSEIVPDAEPSARRKSFAILRSFTSNKEVTRSQKDSVAECATRHLAKESDSMKDSSNIMSRSIRRARLIKNLFDANSQQEESHRSRASLDESISSLNTNTGGGMDVGDSNYKTDVKMLRHVRVSNRLDVHQIDARQSKTFAEFKTTETRTTEERNGETKRAMKAQNTLGMFIHSKKPNESGTGSVKERASMNSDVDTNVDMATKQAHCKVNTVNAQKHSHHVGVSDSETTGTSEKSGKSMSIKDSSSTHLNLKKPPPTSSDGSRLNGKQTTANRPDESVDSIFTMRIALSRSDAENTIPKTISVSSPSKKSFTGTASGHTLLAEPLSLKHMKGHQSEGVSNLSAGTSTTAVSSDEAGLAFDSQEQMRKYPPLTDDEVSDEESTNESQDRYQTLQSPQQMNHSFLALDNLELPVVSSTSVDDSFDEMRESIVVHGQPIQRSSGLASFRKRASRRDTSDATSHAGSNASEATTAITAHTRSLSISGSGRDKNLTLPQQRSPYTHTTVRLAALKARVRVRKQEL